MNREDADGTLAWCARALELADRIDGVEIRLHALNTMGTMRLLGGDLAGADELQRSIALAQKAGLEVDVARGYGNLAWAALRSREYALLDAALDAGLQHCAEPNLDLWRLYLQGFQSRSHLDQGRWTEAAETASVALGDARTSSIPRILAGVSLGLVRARRGDPRSADALDAAHALAEVSEELQRMEAVAAARAEVAWLRGDRDGVALATEATLR
jgi:DNA-binding CsgD family transcriptional regulator